MISTSPSLAADVAFVAEKSFQVRVNAMQNSPEPESKGWCGCTIPASFTWQQLTTFHTY